MSIDELNKLSEVIPFVTFGVIVVMALLITYADDCEEEGK